jgi:hypothetical protein
MRIVALLLSVAFGAAAQQAPSAKQEVSDNIAPHAAPAQPLPYSHKTHVALGLECRRCHTNPDPGNQMTFPATTVCMTCHSTIAKDKPAIMKLAEARAGGPADSVAARLPSHSRCDLDPPQASSARHAMRDVPRPSGASGRDGGEHQRHQHGELYQLPRVA